MHHFIRNLHFLLFSRTSVIAVLKISLILILHTHTHTHTTKPVSDRFSTMKIPIVKALFPNKSRQIPNYKRQTLEG
jgi:hypothetical protein